MKTGIVKAAIVVKSDRFSATFHLEPTKQIDLEMERRRRRIERDRKKLRELLQERREVLARHREVYR